MTPLQSKEGYWMTQLVPTFNFDQLKYGGTRAPSTASFSALGSLLNTYPTASLHQIHCIISQSKDRITRN